MPDTPVTVEVPWRIVSSDPRTVRVQADFGQGRVVTIDMVNAFMSLNGIPYAKRSEIKCGSESVMVTHVSDFLFDYRAGDRNIQLAWISPYSSGEIYVDERCEYQFEPDSPSGVALTTVEGKKILRNARPWRDSDIRNRVVWVSHVAARDLPWPEIGFAAALLCVQTSPRPDRSESAIAPPQRIVQRPATNWPRNEPARKGQDSDSEQAYAKAIPWRTVSKDKKVLKLHADFGGDRLVKLDLIGSSLLSRDFGNAETCRIECGGTILAIEPVGAINFKHHSNNEIVRLLWVRPPMSGEVFFGSEARFAFEPDSVSGCWLKDFAGRKILRQARPWRDGDKSTGVQWVSYVVSNEDPWPDVGLAAALLSFADQLSYSL